MSQYRKILLIADTEMTSTAALTRAALLAMLSGAELRVAMFVHDPAILALGAISGEVMSLARQNSMLRREAWMRERKGELEGVTGRVETRLVWGGPVHEKILQEILDFRPDIVLKDVKTTSGLRQLLFTPLDWQLLRLCPAPLLLVNPEARQAPRRIIAAVDPVRALHEPTHLHDQVIRAALDLALQCDSELHMAHAFEGLMPVVPGEVHTVSLQTAMDNVRKLHSEKLHEYAGGFGVPPERLHFLDGLASISIPQLASDQKADVVVVGTVHRTGLDRVIMGSTAERILQSVHCDVLAVKPEGFMTDLRRYLHVPEAAAPGSASGRFSAVATA